MSGGKAAGYARDVANEMVSRVDQTQQTSQPSNFFENTEKAFLIQTDKLSNWTQRLENISNATAGHQPEEAVEAGKATLEEQPSSWFDRVNKAERNMNHMVDVCENALTRLENLGLF